MTTENPELSIIVNYFNPDGGSRIESMLRFCLECYAAYTSHPHELIVVDGSGRVSAPLADLCDSRGWHYLICHDKGTFARIYNQGMNAARGQYRVWSASDIFVCDGWDERLIGELRRTGAWMVAPYLTHSDYVTQIRLWPFRMRTFRASSMTFNLNMVTKECVDRVGLMDDRFTGNYNDIDYLVRIRRAGGDAVVADAGQILHVARGTSSVSSTFRLEEDLRQFLLKYPELRTTRRTWPYNLAAAGLNVSWVYRLLVNAFGQPGRPLNWLSKFEPFFHSC